MFAKLSSLRFLALLPLLSAAASGAPETPLSVSFAAELRRLRETDHLFQSQPHRLTQQSGFSRKGDNPDRLDYLYREGEWLVYADASGPGVVSRIWSTHGGEWQPIRIEVDGRVLYEGSAEKFFGMDRAPFVAPLCEIRSAAIRQLTAEKETGRRHVWGVSYVPIPFQTRFRYLQKQQLYTNINFKHLPENTVVQPYPLELSESDQRELQLTREAWSQFQSTRTTTGSLAVTDREITVQPGEDPSSRLALTGPGLIREIRLLSSATPAELASLWLEVRWDGATAPAIAVPLDTGLGSLAQRTLALGRTPDGWQYLRFPMPFHRSAEIRLVNRNAAPLSVRVHVAHETRRELPVDTLYLHARANDGEFIAARDRYLHPDVPTAEFYYHNGFTALDFTGRGHIVAYLDRFQCQPELDEHVFLDDERRFPENSWNGTGHEDLFDMAWGHKPHSAALTSGGSQSFAEVNVKLFWNDPLTFRTAVKFNWEWSFKRDVPPPRDARFRSVVYFYAAAEAAAK